MGHFGTVPEGYPEDLWGQDIVIAAPEIWPRVRDLLRAASGYA